MLAKADLGRWTLSPAIFKFKSPDFGFPALDFKSQATG